MAALFDVSDTTYGKMERFQFGLKPKQEENLSSVGIDSTFITSGEHLPFRIPVEKVRKNIMEKFPFLFKEKEEKEEVFEVKNN
jgi:hypothetical protein